MRFAVVDLGSNTFHLLISDLDLERGTFVEVFRKRSFVYLSRGSIKVLTREALSRAENALKLIGALCQAYEVDEIKVFGTAAFRLASNISSVHASVIRHLDTQVDVLSGEQEADYILKGISWTIDSKSVPYVVMDIGGGSVEYIYVFNDSLLRYSINLGISVLRSEWHRDDPPTEYQINSLTETLNTAHQQYIGLEAPQPKFLVGSSGPFEIFQSMLGRDQMSRVEVQGCIQKILSATLSERIHLDGMPSSRADLSLESMAVVAHLLSRCPSIDYLRVSQYGIKEGFIKERLYLG